MAEETQKAIVVSATACFHAKRKAKIAPVNVVHTPPPTGELPKFFSEIKNTGRGRPIYTLKNEGKPSK
jgi:hypothetical protein